MPDEKQPSGEMPRQTLGSTIRRATGINVATCYQCGKCSAGCPMAVESRLRPHDVLRLVQQDRREVLADSSLWLCLTCETCSARCPNACDPARVVDALREIGWKEGVAEPPRKIGAFHRSFLGQIRRSGRIFELGLVMGYKMRSGALFSDVGSVPGMLGRGKLSFSRNRIQGLDEVRRIFEGCLAPTPSRPEGEPSPRREEPSDAAAEPSPGSGSQGAGRS